MAAQADVVFYSRTWAEVSCICPPFPVGVPFGTYLLCLQVVEGRDGAAEDAGVACRERVEEEFR